MPLLAQVKELFESETPVARISAIVGVNECVIVSCLNDLGIRPRSREETKEVRVEAIREFRRNQRRLQYEKIKCLHKERNNPSQIAKKLGVQPEFVLRCFEELKIRAPTPSESNKLRMSKLTPEQRKNLTKKAHAARRRGIKSDRELFSKAVSKQRTGAYIGAREVEVTKQLRARHLRCTPQFAWKRYNIDLMIDEHLAVEIHIGGHPANASSALRKICDLRSSGISVLYLWFTSKSSNLSKLAIEEIVTFHQLTRSNPTPLGQYRVIRSNGDIDAISEAKLNQFAKIVSNYYLLQAQISD